MDHCRAGLGRKSVSLKHLVTPEKWEVLQSDGVFVKRPQKLARTGPIGHDWVNWIITDVNPLRNQ